MPREFKEKCTRTILIILCHINKGNKRGEKSAVKNNAVNVKLEQVEGVKEKLTSPMTTKEAPVPEPRKN